MEQELMTTELLYVGMVADIKPILDECHIPEDAYFLGEQLPQHVVGTLEERQNLLLFVPYSANLPFGAYTSGRVFHRDFELRWEKEEDKLRVVYLGTHEHCPASLTFVQEVSMQATKFYYLFGERLRPDDLQKIGKPVREGDFSEVRIPRLLRYPPVKSSSRRVQLAVCESIEERTGQVEQYRFQGIKGE
jgi:hypothetical protein